MIGERKPRPFGNPWGTVYWLLAIGYRLLAIGYRLFFPSGRPLAIPAICHLSFGICHSEARASVFISLAHSPLSATVTALFFEETLSSSGLGHRPFTGGNTGSNPVRVVSLEALCRNTTVPVWI